MAPLPTLGKLRIGRDLLGFFPCYFNLFLCFPIFFMELPRAGKKPPGMGNDPSLLDERRDEAPASGVAPNSPQTPKNSSPGEFPAPTERSPDFFRAKYGTGCDYCNYSNRNYHSGGNWVGKTAAEFTGGGGSCSIPGIIRGPAGRGSKHPDPIGAGPDHCRVGLNWI